MQASKSAFDRRGVSVVVVSFAEPGTLGHYQDVHRWPFAILADPNRAAYQAFTLKRFSWLRVFSPATLRLYWRLWRSGHRHQDYGKEDIYQAGGDFILDRQGTVLYAHRSQDPSDRPSAAKLVAAFDQSIPAIERERNSAAKSRE